MRRAVDLIVEELFDVNAALFLVQRRATKCHRPLGSSYRRKAGKNDRDQSQPMLRHEDTGSRRKLRTTAGGQGSGFLVPYRTANLAQPQGGY